MELLNLILCIILNGLILNLKGILAEKCASESISCDLHKSSVCGWSQDDTDDFDWTWHERLTPTSFTGPNHAHSGKTDPPQKQSNIARLVSPPFTASTRVQHWFSFWFFMWGDGIDELRLILEDSTGVKQELRKLEGVHERNWLQTNVTFHLPRSSSAIWYTLVFEGVVGANQQSDIAIDTFEASPSLCRSEPTKDDSSNVPTSFDCKFDQVSICGKQEENNLFEWAWRMTTSTYWNDVEDVPYYGLLYSTNRRPHHILAYSKYADWYLFLASNHALEYGDQTTWISPAFKATHSRRTEKCITFKYMMNGQDIKYLRVFLQDGEGLRKEIWSRYGHQGRKWRVASVTFSVPLEQSCHIIMEVQRGLVSTPWVIAVNDVRVSERSCYVISQRPHVQDPVYPKEFSCSFETSSLCGWTQKTDDDFNWTHRYNTPFLNAPSTGNTVSVNHRIGACKGKSNYFLDVMQNYMTDIPDEWSRAVLRSPRVDATFGEQRCFGFYYYMDFGKFGALRIYQVAENRNSKRRLLWKRSKNHKKEWNKVEISFNTTGGQWEYLEFEAERGSLKKGDIAIDDVMLSGVSCEVLHMPERLPKALAVCSFDDEALCGWQQTELDDDFDWTRQSGSTPSSYTGPNRAHDSSDGYYMFIEASSPRSRYDKAELWSPALDGTAGEKRCLKFWYHMYGTGIGKLTVLQYGNFVFEEQRVIKGNHGSQWTYEEVTFDTSGGSKEQVVLRAERGWSNRGDIAVDDISIEVGQC